MQHKIVGGPIKSDEFDLYEMWLLATDLLRDFDLQGERKLDVETLEGAGRDIARAMWRQALEVNAKALSQRAVLLREMMSAAGLVPHHAPAIAYLIGVSPWHAVDLFRGLLALRVADGECFRRRRRPRVITGPANDLAAVGAAAPIQGSARSAPA